MSVSEGLGRPGGPALGFSYEGRPNGLLEAVVPFVDLIEVIPDCVVGPDARLQAGPRDELDRHAAHLPVAYHGIGLSIGTVGGWNPGYLDGLDALIAYRTPVWHSEHLGFSVVDHHFLGTMGALPATREVIDLVASRGCTLRDRYGLEVLFEHVATPIPRPDEMPLAIFLNELHRASGCGILLDLHNLECDADNGLLDLDGFFVDLDFDVVREIHVAGGIWDGGFHLDVHSNLPAPSTIDLLGRILPRCRNVDAVVFELLGEAVPLVGAEAIVAQLTETRRLLDGVVHAAG
jgi:uncharacterized protein (UPF0276 family)